MGSRELNARAYSAGVFSFGRSSSRAEGREKTKAPENIPGAFVLTYTRDYQR